MKNRVVSLLKIIACLLLQQKFQAVEGFASSSLSTTNHRTHPSFFRHPSHHRTFLTSSFVPYVKHEEEEQRRRLSSVHSLTRRLSSTSPLEELAAETPTTDNDDEDDAIQQHLIFAPSAQDDDDSKRQQRPELWLDLRGTALSPSEALDHLQELLLMNHRYNPNQHDDNDDDENSNTESKQPLILSWIDRVVVSPEKIFQQSRNDDDEAVYYVTNDNPGDYQLLVQSRNNKSFPIGKVNSIYDTNHDSEKKHDDSSFYWKLNPLLAMETVSSEQWYWLDCQSAAWTTASCAPALTSLLDMVTLAATADATSLPKSTTSPLLGLFESSYETQPTTTTTATDQSSTKSDTTENANCNNDNDNDELTSTAPIGDVRCNTHVGGGGLALTCPTQDALWQAASLVMQQNQQGRSEMTKSGILVPSSMTTIATPLLSSDPRQSIRPLQSSSSVAAAAAVKAASTRLDIVTKTTGNKVISLALVLPFDAGLWKMAETLLTTNNDDVSS